MNNLKSLIVTVMTLMSAALGSQAQALWTSASLKTTPINKHWGVDAEVEWRTKDSFKGSDRATFSGSAEYKHRFFKVDAGYKYMMTRSDARITNKGNFIPAYWIGRHRYFASLSGKLKVGRFELSLREHYQMTHRLGKWVPKYASDHVTPKQDEWIAPKDRHVLRSRVACEWNIRKCRFTPFASVEIYDDLQSGFEVEKLRYTLGTEYKINRHNRVEIFYRFLQGVAGDEENCNIIGIGYSFKL